MERTYDHHVMTMKDISGNLITSRVRVDSKGFIFSLDNLDKPLYRLVETRLVCPRTGGRIMGRWLVSMKLA